MKRTSRKSARKTAAASTRNRIDQGLHIVPLVKDNPRRKGTFGYKSFAKIRKGMPVEKFVAAGGRLRDLRWDLQHNNLKLVKKAA
jgi:hypothetical protein